MRSFRSSRPISRSTPTSSAASVTSSTSSRIPKALRRGWPRTLAHFCSTSMTRSSSGGVGTPHVDSDQAGSSQDGTGGLGRPEGAMHHCRSPVAVGGLAWSVSNGQDAGEDEQDDADGEERVGEIERWPPTRVQQVDDAAALESVEQVCDRSAEDESRGDGREVPAPCRDGEHRRDRGGEGNCGADRNVVEETEGNAAVVGEAEVERSGQIDAIGVERGAGPCLGREVDRDDAERYGDQDTSTASRRSARGTFVGRHRYGSRIMRGSWWRRRGRGGGCGASGVRGRRARWRGGRRR